ncbi:phosphate transporter PHO1 homolog 9-like isoform X2 [Primulina huaijiensis]|uniref:phosphate transporter PHO1 homolog 9-like isoform X2 n=1 Tax=Primulina huaijiensis TaxID=1492673 RepID=UPI003CC7644F
MSQQSPFISKIGSGRKTRFQCTERMKFGKELASQTVQEWQEAYMDYKHLKKLLKNIFKVRQQSALPYSVSRGGFLKRKSTLHRSFSGLMDGDNCSIRSDDEVILVHPVRPESLENDVFYQTIFLKPSEDGGENEIHFFKILDKEFNKVLRFYKEKVKDVTLQAVELSKQMDKLVALRIEVYKPLMEQNGNLQEVESSNTEPEAKDPVNRGHDEDPATNVVQELGTSQENASENNTFPPAYSFHAKINIEPKCPLMKLRRIIKSTNKSNLTIRIEELRRAEEKLRWAFIQYYRQLGLLKIYRSSNISAFSKIMKKYDKITSRSASNSYLQMIDKSDLGSLDEVNMLIGRVEAAFVKYFSNGNRRKGVKLLKPRNKMEKHRITFVLGMLTGCSVALVIGIIVSMHARGLIRHEGREQYMNNIFPLYSFFGFIFLHMLVYGINTYLWRRFRVNYPFIFGFKSGTELGFREIFLLASALSVLTLVAVLSNLDMEMDPRTQHYQTLTELVPAGLVMILLLITFCPFNIMYRSSRYFLIRCTWRSLFAPLYKVTFSDFFLADQLTSQVQAFRSLQFYICYYGWGDFKRRSNQCLESKVYEIFYIVVPVIPFLSRVLQCLRRVFEEKNLMQGLNSLKYFLTVVALVIRTIYDFRRGTFWRIMAASSSGVTTIFNTYWDIVMDWGLLQKKARNPWLRDKLLISNRTVYFVAIVVNILLRLVWMQLVLEFNEAPFLHRRAMIALVACLEILRRGIWNFFRFDNTSITILRHRNKLCLVSIFLLFHIFLALARHYKA